MATLKCPPGAAVVALLLAGQILVPTVHSDWSNTIVAVVPTLDEAQCGETVTVTLRLDANPDGDTYIDWRVKLGYNTSALTYIGFAVNPEVWASGSGAGAQQKGGDSDGWVRIGEGNFTGESVNTPTDLGTVTFEVIGEGSSDLTIVTNDPYADTGFTDPDKWPAYAPGSTSVTQVDLFCNEPPLPDAGGPYAGDRTETLKLDGGGSSDPDGTIVNYAWELDGAQVYSGASATYDLALAGYALGDHGVVLTVADNEGATEQDEATLTVENAPPIANDDTAVTSEETPIAIDMTANDRDPDGEIDPGTVSIEEGPEHSSVELDPVTGVGTVTPIVDFSGADAFTYVVRDNDGTVSNAAMVSVTVNAAPVISHLDPVSAVVGSPALNLTVHGNHFIADSTVRWNGEARSTAFVTGSQLRAYIPADDLTAVGEAAVTVFNPASLGGTSNTVPFTVVSVEPNINANPVYLPLVNRNEPSVGTRDGPVR